MKNKSFYVERSLIDNGILSVRHANLIQYYVTGYRSSIDKSYAMPDCKIVGLQVAYDYTGYQIRPSFSLKSNVGGTLVDGIDYVVEYGNNISSSGTLSCIGVDPWEGVLVSSFAISGS